jgi:SNF2 family DNA or RNA helicase
VAIATLGFPDTLIVAQKRGIGVWESHFEEWYGVKVKTYVSGKAKYADIKSPGILVTNYEQLGDILARRVYWPIIVFDEAQELRNRNTQRYTKAKHLSASYLWMLSGTPVFKGAQDLWAPLAMIAPQKFPAYWPFVDKYCFKDKSWGGSINVYGIKDPLRLAQDISPYFLRRLKKDVLPEIPLKARYKLPVHMTAKQKVAYIDLVKQMYTEAENELVLVQSAAVRTIRLRELLVSPRLLGIDDDGAAIPFLIDRLEERGTPSMVATPFRAGVSEIARLVRAAGWEVHELIGGLSPSRSTAAWQGFQNSKNPKRIIVFTTQMGTAWTGTAAEQFYAVGYDWAPQVNEQAEDRMNRYGGTGYECYYFTHFGTIDEHVLEVNAGKQTVESLIVNHQLILDRGRM